MKPLFRFRPFGLVRSHTRVSQGHRLVHLVLMLGFGLSGLLVAKGRADTTRDLSAGWRFATDAKDRGVAQRWFAADFDDRAWQELDAGKPWNAQGFADYSGIAWYRKRVAVPAAWRNRKIYLVFRGVANWLTLYCNGRRIAPYGNFGRPVNRPVLADMSARLRPGEENLLALRIHGRGPRSGLVKAPVFLTTDPARVPPITQPACFVTYADDLATVRVAMRGLGRGSFPEATVEMEILTPDRSKTVARRIVPFPAYAMDALCTFSMPHTKERRTYPVETVCRDAGGNTIPGTALPTTAVWPGDPVRPPAYAKVKVLNNFVAELLGTTCSQHGGDSWTFSNPRPGWVFFRVCRGSRVFTAEPGLYLDGAPAAIVLRAYPRTGDLEAFQYLPAGKHVLRVAGAPARRVLVRAVPELGYYQYPTRPILPAFNRTGSRPYYSQDFMDRHVLPNANVLFTSSKESCGDLFNIWRREGRRWVGRTHMIDLGQERPKPGRETYAFWARTAGVLDPAFRGIIVDEFAPDRVSHFAQWLNALKLLDADTHFAGKTFYAFCNEMYRYPHTYDVLRYLMEKNHLFAYEQYLSSTPNLQQERCYITRHYVHDLREWQRLFPDILKRMHVCVTFATAPIAFDTDPRVNFNVGLDMQMRSMATEPDLQDIYGVMEWYAGGADEETLRLGMLLYRHYAIEGKTEPMLTEPFELHHIDNPDFEFGLRGWEVTAAEKGSVSRGYIAGFSLVPNRYWPIYKGDTFVSMKRSKKGPNRVCQTIKALEPGKLYALKLFAADLHDLDSTARLGMAVDIDGVDIVTDLSFDTIFRGSTSIGRFKNVHGTLYRIVFRARRKSARLTISDWRTHDQGGGHPDQNLACNYVLVRPYHPAAR